METYGPSEEISLNIRTFTDSPDEHRQEIDEYVSLYDNAGASHGNEILDVEEVDENGNPYDNHQHYQNLAYQDDEELPPPPIELVTNELQEVPQVEITVDEPQPPQDDTGDARGDMYGKDASAHATGTYRESPTGSFGTTTPSTASQEEPIELAYISGNSNPHGNGVNINPAETSQGQGVADQGVLNGAFDYPVAEKEHVDGPGNGQSSKMNVFKEEPPFIHTGDAEGKIIYQKTSRFKTIVGVCCVVIVIAAFAAVGLVVGLRAGKSDEKDMVSVTVDKEYHAELVILYTEYSSELQDRDSSLYRQTEDMVIEKIDDAFIKSPHADSYVKTTVNGFRQGSLVAILTIHMRATVQVERGQTTSDIGLTNAQILDVVDVSGFQPIAVSKEDNCADAPCKRGQCISLLNNFQCHCPLGFEGKRCDIDADECSSAPCQHGGTCTDHVAGYTCACPFGTSGQDCEIEIDECNSEPCLHGGVCEDLMGGFRCTCQPGYFGVTCQERIPFCASEPCVNGGSCEEAVNGFTCLCAPLFSGGTCETEINVCENDPCMNGGTCQEGLDGFICACAPGYGGTTCATDIDECKNNPCIHGWCEDHVNNYTCNCYPGYQGLLCEDDVNECLQSPCANNGSCYNSPGSFSCDCMEGYYGHLCTEEMVTCGGNFTALSGDFSSPNFPDLYMSMARCSYHIGAPSGYNICVTFHTINLSAGDQITVYNGSSMEGSFLARFTGMSYDNETVCSSNNSMLVYFFSDFTGNEMGFNASYGANRNPSYCGGKYTGLFGEITSPNYPQIFIYPPAMECIYNITVPSDRTACIIFDNVNIIKGAMILMDNHSETIAFYFQSFSNDMPICASTNILLATLASVYPEGQMSFNATYYALDRDSCGATYTDLTGNFTSPNFSNNYPVLSYCQYNITVPFGYHVCIWFNYLNVSSGDLVTTSENSITNTTVIDRIRGFQPFHVVCSVTNMVIVALFSDAFETSSGFDASYFAMPNLIGSTTFSPETTTQTSTTFSPETSTRTSTNVSPETTTTSPSIGACGGNFSAQSGQFSSPDYPFVYPKNADCKYTIAVDSRYYICVIFTVVDTETCCDTITVYNGPTSTSRQISKFSGERRANLSACSTGNLMLVHFQSDYSVSHNGFLANYNVTSRREDCMPDQFVCDTNKCIDNFRLCDQTEDCNDKTDEQGCSCAKGYIGCSVWYDTCFPTNSICDGQNDCPAGEDEKGCDCDYQRCNDGSGCFNDTQRCDDIVDCYDHSDELLCQFECTENEFSCYHTRQCVPLSSRCDGVLDCDDKSDEWLNCPPITTKTPPETLGYEIRLNDGENDTTSQAFGKIIIKRIGVDEEFGTICDDGFDLGDAVVICRQLGFIYTVEEHIYFSSGSSHFGTFEGPIWLSNLRCNGSESRLSECASSVWGNHFCSHQQDVSISCGGNNIFTTMTPDVTSTTTPATTASPESSYRLADGEFCWTGRVEIYHGGIWGTICRPRFDALSPPPGILCKTLGFSEDNAEVRYGPPGSGPSFIDRITCSYGSSLSSCLHNGWDPKVCYNNETVYVTCDKDSVTEENCPFDVGTSNVNCSFGDMCGYNVSVVNGDSMWQFNYIQQYDDQLPSLGFNGRSVVFTNQYAGEMDSSLLESPAFKATSRAMKVEFMYLLRKPTISNLMFGLRHEDENDGNTLWQSGFLKFEEKDWLYQCVNLNNMTINTTEYKLQFYAIRGSDPLFLVAVDDIMVSPGVCAESLLDVLWCSFDRLSSCGVSVDCNKCGRSKSVYKWRRYIDDNEDAYMMADASYGRLSDDTTLSFTLPHLGDNKAIALEYFISDAGVLKIQLVSNTTVYDLSTIDENTMDFFKMTCMKIPKEIDVTSDLRIEFKAIRGSNPRSDIGLDNVEVLKECPHPVFECSNDHDCGWLYRNDSAQFGWQYLDRSNSSINPTNGPAFTIRYANASSSALSSLLETRMFEHPGGPFKLTFKYRKSAKEIFQVWMYDHSKNETIQLSKITLPSEDENIHCIDISPDLNGTLSIGFMDTFLPNNMTMDKQISTLIYDFALQEGHCKVPLSARDCTFEDNLCSYTTTDGYGSCTSRYQWQLVESHNKDQGHIMSIMMDENREEMTYLDGASIVFEPFIIDLESRGCSLSFDFSIVNRSTYMGENGTDLPGYLMVTMNDYTRKLPLSPQPKSSFCFDICSISTAGNVTSISLMALAVNAWVENIRIEKEKCPERSVECRFTDGMSCGYNVDKMIWKDGDLSTDPDRKDEGAVFSPPFMFDSDQNCITIGLSGLVMSQFKLALLNSDGENVLWFYETEIAIQQGIGRNFSVDIPGHQTYVLRLQFFPLREIMLNYIHVQPETCHSPGMSCAQGEFKCNGTCFDNDRLCDGVRDCLDGEDEEGCDCRSDTFSCSTSTECIHNSLYCDGTADCADASDEMCDGSVECDFRLGPSGTCKYQLHGVHILPSGPNAGKLDVTSSLAYIISPQFTIDVDSCLIVGFLPYYGHNQFLRTAALQNRNLTTTYIPRKMLKTYTTMPNTSISFMTGLGPGGYDGVLIEAQDVDILVHNASIKVNRGLFQSVALMPNPCEALVDNTSSEHRYTSKGYGESTTTHRTQTTRSHTATPNDMQTTMGRTVRLKRGIPQTGTTSNSNITVTQNFSTTIPPSTNNSTQETHSTQEPTTTRRVTTSYSTHETKTKSESTHGSMYTTKSSQETKITTESTQGSISTTNSTQGPNNTSETTQGNAYATNSTQVVYTTSSTQGHKNTSESTQGNMYTTYFTQETKTTTEFTQESMSTTKFAQGSKTTSESTQGPKTTVSSTQRPETTMTSTQASMLPMVSISQLNRTRLGQNASLVCSVLSVGNQYVILYWKSLIKGVIARNSDVLLDVHNRSVSYPFGKFTVELHAESQDILYTLNVAGVDNVDEGDIFECVIDIVGYPEDIWPKASVQIEILDFGCHYLKNGVCGYNMVTFPTLSGLDNVNDMLTRINAIESSLGRTSEDKCVQSMLDLACGLHVTQCIDGLAEVGICRHSCENIAKHCGQNDMFPIVNEGNLDIAHYCKYLPLDRDTCRPIWLDCGAVINVSDPSPNTFIPENYPLSPTSSRCTYSFSSKDFHQVNLKFHNVVLSTNCSESYIEVSGSKYCHDNISSLTMGTFSSSSQITNVTLVSTKADAFSYELDISSEMQSDVCGIIEIPDVVKTTINLPTHNDCHYWVLQDNSKAYLGKTTVLRLLDSSRLCVRFTNMVSNTSVCEGDDLIMEDERLLLYASETVVLQVLQVFRRTRPRVTSMLTDTSEVLISIDDGEPQYWCGSLIQPHTGQLICREAEKGQYIGNGENSDSSCDTDPRRCSNASTIIICRGYEDNLSDCIVIECNPIYRQCSCAVTTTISCKTATVTCDHRISECGYMFSYREFNRSGKGLTKLDAGHNEVARIVSPAFEAGYGESVTFGYQVSNLKQWISVKLELANGTTDTIWTPSVLTSKGEYRGCANIPEKYVDHNVRLVFEMYDVYLNQTLQGFVFSLTDVYLDEGVCAATLLRNCEFDQARQCGIGSDSGICFGDKDELGPVWMLDKNNLVADTTYATPNMEYAVSLLANTSGMSSLSLSYSVRKPTNEMEKLQFKIFADTDLIFTGDTDVIQLPMKKCINIPNSFHTLRLALETGTTNGIISIDRLILMEEKRCIHKLSCDFENITQCSITIEEQSNVYFSWRMGIDRIRGKVMELFASNSDIQEGVTATFEISNIQLRDESGPYRCLSFNYTALGNDNQFYLDIVEKKTNDVRTTYTVDTPTNGWRTFYIPIQSYSDVENDTRSFEFIATAMETMRNGTKMYIDDLHYQREPCPLGLQHIRKCGFEDPALCLLDTTGAGGFSWERTHSLGNLSTDSDGTGYYMSVDNSYGPQGAESLLWFTVDLSSNNNTQYYQFSYQMDGTGAGKLKTYTMDNKGITGPMYDIENYNTDMWIISDCYSLPSRFIGRIYFKAIKGTSPSDDIAIDNVKIGHGTCEAASVSCSFDRTFCGYNTNFDMWSFSGNSVFTKYDNVFLHAPLYSLNLTDDQEVCVSVFFDGNYIELRTGSDSTENVRIIHSSDIVPDKIGQITVSKETLRLAIKPASGTRVSHIQTEDGSCKELQCDFPCEEQCIDSVMVCDTVLQCYNGEDEKDCGNSVTCDFSNGSCGYMATEASISKWEIASNISIETNGVLKVLEPAHGTGIMVTYMNSKETGYAKMQSTEYRITEPSCLQFYYTGNSSMFAVNISSYIWMDKNAASWVTTWKMGQLNVSAMTMRAMFVANFTSNRPAFIAVDKVELIEGSCTKDTLECVDVTPYKCENGERCYSENERCNGIPICNDLSDESESICNSVRSLSCDFEDDHVCGYNVRDAHKIYSLANDNWRRRQGFAHSIPHTDHTFRNYSGHYLQFVVYQHDSKYKFSYGALASPSIVLPSDGCVTFWYILNATEIRPNGHSAQITANLNYNGSIETHWYDQVNRPFSEWVQGGIPVRGGKNVSLIIEATVFEPITAWPGVVAVDDIDFHAGPCNIKQECSTSSFTCKENDMCIPIVKVCDGERDCLGGSDEMHCDIRPNGTIELSGGDGSYGEVRMFVNGTWHRTCFPYPSSIVTESKFIAARISVAHPICKIKGYIGNADLFEIRRGRPNAGINLNCTDGWCYPGNNASCTSFLGVACSNNACFSGEELCRGTTDTCIPKTRFCDGLPDCEGNTDETDCYCDLASNDNLHCTKRGTDCTGSTCKSCNELGMFECINHECVNKSLRCDGKSDCKDGTDEYKCVFVNETGVHIYQSGGFSPVCINDIDRAVADGLCNLAGKGMIAANGIRHGLSLVNGGILVTLSTTDIAYQGLHRFTFEHISECYPLRLECQYPECGTISFTDEFIQPQIINGEKSLLGAWPWQGALRYTHSGICPTTPCHMCGISYLGGRWALTAAHCVEGMGSEVYVWFGVTDSGDKLQSQGQEIPVVRAYPHHKYELFVFADIALLELEYEPNIDNFTRTICLGNEDMLQEIISQEEDAECYITGYGNQEDTFFEYGNTREDLRETKVGIVDPKLCSDIVNGQTEPRRQEIGVDAICVENTAPFSPSCNGDSGGPFVCRMKDGRFKQFGVTSWGLRGCDLMAPAIYTNVAHHLEWIQNITGIVMT
ncbi:uncharacterized protein LOC128240004 [Mya arenaria]|uniref:uncharacterized protein LOC128240004 n=1 Tax=Mya arenaria TaxID=6604 RepID=UPI0022E374B1|nr:uncharacterized protein LOC128240004 [Mya arenaria]